MPKLRPKLRAAGRKTTRERSAVGTVDKLEARLGAALRDVSPHIDEWDFRDVAACVAYYERHGVTKLELHIMVHALTGAAQLELLALAKNWTVRPE